LPAAEVEFYLAMEQARQTYYKDKLNSIIQNTKSAEAVTALVLQILVDKELGL